MFKEMHTVLTEDQMFGKIPWFLDVRNPEVIAKRAKDLAEFNEQQRKEAAERTAMTVKIKNLEKSVAMAPAPVKEEVKPVVKAADPKKAAAYADDAVITVLTDDFKHREGSQAADKSALFATGQTVAEFVAAGEGLGLKNKWQMLHVKNAVAKGQIKVEG